MRTEDGYIIHKCLNGEKEAFGFLVDKYKASVHAFAYSKLHNFHDAEDIAQEVFLQAFRKLHTLRRWDSFLAWLYVITSNLCKKFIRQQSIQPDGEFIEDIEPAILVRPSVNSYQEEQTFEALDEALDSLPEMYRQVLTLYYLGGMSSEGVARFLGTSPSNIRQRLSRARSKLKKEVIDMMSNSYDQQKLQPSFTFRIVEMVKPIKIQPAPRTTWLPFGLSAATGIVFTVLMFSSSLISLTPLRALLGSPMPSETKVKQVGELPVDVLEISEIKFLSGDKGNSSGGTPDISNPPNAFAPQLKKQADKTNQSTIIGKDGAEMMLILPGEFKMGSEDELVVRSETQKPVHTVYLDAFYMDVYEVTNTHYAKFLNEYGKNEDTAGHQLLNFDRPACLIEKVGKRYKPRSGYENHPVIQVSWYGAAEYAKFYGKRLPTEAEWEKAARGGLVGKKYPWGDEAPDGTQCNFADKNNWSDWSDKTADDGYQYTSPVGSYPKNGYGLYDMAGNVSEWCSDWYDPQYYQNSPKNNPAGPNSGIARVQRGGNFNALHEGLRVAHRYGDGPTYTSDCVGFRCLLQKIPENN